MIAFSLLFKFAQISKFMFVVCSKTDDARVPDSKCLGLFVVWIHMECLREPKIGANNVLKNYFHHYHRH